MQKIFERLKAEMAAFALKNHFNLIDKGRFARVVDPQSPRGNVMSVQLNKEGFGKITREDATGSTPFREVVDYVSPVKNPAVVEVESNKTDPAAKEWKLPDNAGAGMPAPADLTALLGTAGDKVGDLRAIRNLSIKEIVARIPRDAELRELPPRPDGATMGFEYTWKGLNANNEVTTMRLRVHGPDPGAAAKAPAGNSATGWVVIVERGNGRMDGDGRFHPNSALNPRIPDPKNAGKMIDNPLVDATHIPIRSPSNPLPPIAPVNPRPGERRRDTVPAPVAP